MSNKKNAAIKIVMKDNKIITKSDLFEKKEKFHENQSRLPFEEKIQLLVRLREIANKMRNKTRKNKLVWKIHPISKINQ